MSYFKGLQVLGDLAIDYILFKVDFPVLFTCENKNNKLYLCLCCDIRKEQRWIITGTTTDVIIQLLSNKLTIQDAFLNSGSNIFTITKQLKTEDYIVEDSYDILDLPTMKEYIDADSDDLESYILTLSTE